MDLSVPPMSANSCPICSLPVASPHLGNMTWASSANRSRMLPPVVVVPALSKALRYSRATDLRCSSVIVWVAMATGNSYSSSRGVGARSALRVEGAPGDETRVVGAAVADRPHGRVGAARFVLDRSVEQQLDRLLAAVEVLVDAALGEAVEPRDRLPQV